MGCRRCVEAKCTRSGALDRARPGCAAQALNIKAGGTARRRSPCVWNDPTLTSLIANPEAAARTWYARHKVVSINHMVVVTERLAKSDPEAVKEIVRRWHGERQPRGCPSLARSTFFRSASRRVVRRSRRSSTMRCSKASFHEKSTLRNCLTQPRARCGVNRQAPSTGADYPLTSTGSVGDASDRTGVDLLAE
jgi:hypothetical protein